MVEVCAISRGFKSRTARMGKISKDGKVLISLIEDGINTEEAIEKASGRNAESVARTLAALSRRGTIRRRFLDGTMRYEINPGGVA